MRYAIGLDIGGTQIRAGAIGEGGEALCLLKGDSCAKGSPEGVLEAIAALFDEPEWKQATANALCIGMGVGMAGLVSGETGLVYASPHFPAFQRYPFKAALAARFPGFPIALDNDTNALALGEFRLGTAKDWPDFLLVALGTGIGGALVRGGKIDRGTNGFAGEIGHIAIDRKGPECPCGSRGCLETLASGSGLMHIAREDRAFASFAAMSPEAIGAHLFDRAQAGDAVALLLYRRFGENLAIGLGSLMNAMGLHRIALAGGISRASAYFLPTLEAALPRYTYTAAFVPPEIRVSTLIPWGGVYGAVALLGM